MSVPKGFRDIEPDVARVRYKVIDELRRNYELFGFNPLETPAIEYWETLSGKYGEEAESKLIWRFVDPFSNREYALRYDLTVPLARYVASHPELPLPFKRYQIGLVWRHEEPQRMRYREFMQADADIVGSPYVEADAEVVNVTLRGLWSVGLSDAYVRINHRKLIYHVFEKELQIDNPLPVLRIVDKLDKIGPSGVENELLRVGMNESTVRRIMELIQIKGRWGEAEEQLRKVVSQGGVEVINELAELFSLITSSDKSSIFDLSMVRGLDYYTGPIFEFNVESTVAPSVGGGGRYDGLIGLLSKKMDLPATGASIGVDRVVDILVREKQAVNAYREAKVYVIYLKQELYKYAWEIAMFLRNKGIRAEIDLMRRSEAKQRKNALSSGATHLLFIGEKEIATSMYTLYEVSSGQRITAGLEDIAKHVQSA
jgi:histidyl-tRNA synthetase